MGLGLGRGRKSLAVTFFNLPELPLVTLPPIPFEPHEKVPGIAVFAGDRPAAWVDDNVTPEAREWAEQREPSTLLVAVHSAKGLERAAVDELLEWAGGLSRTDEAPSELR